MLMNANSRSPRALALSAGFALLIPCLLHAQVPGSARGSGGFQVVAAAGHEFYGFATPEATNIESLSLSTLTFGARVPLAGATGIGLRGSFARASLRRADGQVAEISGPTDTELSLGLPFRRGSLTSSVTAILVLPTGNSTHTPEEVDVAGAIAADLLPFRISNWGSGGAAGLHASAAHTLQRGSIGFGATYLVAREFEPVDGLATYRPGDQLQLQAAFDHAVGGSAKLTVSLLAQRYGDDSWAGLNLYRTGNRYQATGSYSFRASARASALLYAAGVHRSAGTSLQEHGAELPSQKLLLAGGGMRLPLGRATLVPSVDARVFRRADGVGQGFLTGIGAALEYPAGTTILVPSVRGRFGSVIEREGSESGITGFEVGLATRFGTLPRR
jgi:hypothetical protein